MDAIFANPAALWAALLVAPLLLLFMLRHRPVKKRIPSIVLWQGAAQMQVATSPFQRLRNSISLLLLLAALVALVLALAGLRIPGARAAGTPIVLVVDITAGMQAVRLGESRLETARNRALELLDSAGNAPVTLLAWDGSLRPASPALGTVARARDGLNALEAVDYGADDAMLLRALARLAEEPGQRRIVLASDHSPGTLPPGVLLLPCGPPLANSGIVAAALTEVTSSQQELFFALEHFGPSPARVAVRIERMTSPTQAELVDARDLLLTPGERASVTLPVRLPGLYRATLAGDAFALDDTAYVRFSRLPVQDVALDGPVPTPLRKAVAAMETANGTVRLIDAAAAGPDTMFVFAHQPAGASPRLPCVYLLPAGTPDGVSVQAALPAADSPARPARHPLWRGAGVPDIRVPNVIPVVTDRLLLPLMETGPGPALALLRRPDDSRLDDLLVCFPLDDEATGFAAKLAFVVFWENWFDAGRRLRDPLPRGALSTQDSTEIPALAGRAAFRYGDWESAATEEASPGRSLRLERAGGYRFEGLEGADPELIGVSLLDAAESNLMQAPTEEFDADLLATLLAEADTGGQRGDLSLAPWLALLAAGLVLAEWVLFRRRYAITSQPTTGRKSSTARHTAKLRA
ncbi:MAG: BatA domain-containing protein [Planctomycetes bacterium]|nr:BatA domain-containing protein [Planctomycetota bacterium]